jgi:hypothetical protein
MCWRHVSCAICRQCPVRLPSSSALTDSSSAVPSNVYVADLVRLVYASPSGCDSASTDSVPFQPSSASAGEADTSAIAVTASSATMNRITARLSRLRPAGVKPA